MKKTRNKFVKLIHKYVGKKTAVKISMQPLIATTSFGNGRILMYIKLSKHKIKRTEEVVQNRIYIDYDRKNEIVGVEIL